MDVKLKLYVGINHEGFLFQVKHKLWMKEDILR